MKKNTEYLCTFSYQGITQAGQPMKGQIQATTRFTALMELRKQGIATRILRKKNLLFTRTNKRITSNEIALFAKQLAMLVDAGIPLLQCFDIIAKGQNNRRMYQLIQAIKHTVAAGLPLAESFKKHPQYFNDLFCNLIKAGEQSGTLEIMLAKIALYKEKIEAIKKKTTKALTYPLAVLIVAFMVTTGMLLFIVPQFESLFKGFGAQLPSFTQGIIHASVFLKRYGYLIFLLIAGMAYALIYAKKHSPKFARLLEYLLLQLPLMGDLIIKAAIARFSRTLSITLAAGLPLLDAFEAVAQASGIMLFSQNTNKIRLAVLSGVPISTAMQDTQLFPNKVIQMVAVGEESGTLEKMLSTIADFYEEEVENKVTLFNSLLEPAIMSVLGVLVGGLIIALYLPIFKLGSVV